MAGIRERQEREAGHGARWKEGEKEVAMQQGARWKGEGTGNGNAENRQSERPRGKSRSSENPHPQRQSAPGFLRLPSARRGRGIQSQCPAVQEGLKKRKEKRQLVAGSAAGERCRKMWSVERGAWVATAAAHGADVDETLPSTCNERKKPQCQHVGRQARVGFGSDATSRCRVALQPACTVFLENNTEQFACKASASNAGWRCTRPAHTVGRASLTAEKLEDAGACISMTHTATAG